MNDVIQLRRLGLFDARVPRYTSYPTANHFNAEIGAGQMASWIAAIPPGSQISLYVHVPFCRRLCWFCACRTQGTATGAPLRGYLDTLRAEIALLQRHLPADVTLARLHFGGGTPTMLDPAMLVELTKAITDVAPLAQGAEFSVEIDPNEIDAPRMDALAAAGMNRASIGVQDFDELIQATIGRPQSFEVTKIAADGLRARGITSLNVDLLFGLPHQSEVGISETVQKVLSLTPDRVALYGYAHVPWMARRQAMIPTEALPAPEARLALYEAARKLFLWDGYREIGIDHFARPGDGLDLAAQNGRLRRNFQGYTDDTAPVLIGLGASSISRFPQGFAQNNAATSGYGQAVGEGRFATTRGHEFNPDDRIREAMINALMCDFRIDVADLAGQLKIAPSRISDRLRGIDRQFGTVLNIDETGIAIRSEGRPLTRMIARYLDAYSSNPDGHSAAI